MEEKNNEIKTSSKNVELLKAATSKAQRQNIEIARSQANLLTKQSAYESKISELNAKLVQKICPISESPDGSPFIAKPAVMMDLSSKAQEMVTIVPNEIAALPKSKSAPLKKGNLQSIVESPNNNPKASVQKRPQINDATPQKRQRSDPAISSVLKPLNTNEVTPASVRRTRHESAKILISFSGFKDKTKFDSALRKEVMIAVKQLPDSVCVVSKADYDPRVTHMICPPGSRTLKSFAATLSGAWVIHDPDWVLESLKAKSWLPENKFGYQGKNPFQGKSFHLLPEFAEGSESEKFRKEFIKTLVVNCSDGKVVDSMEKADYVLRGDADERYMKLISVYPHQNVMDWTEFLSMIPQA